MNAEALTKTVVWMEAIARMKKEGKSEEDKQAWIASFGTPLETQHAFPLLMQTMTAANFMDVKALLDELCKCVADTIAMRTPNEILDFFNIRKDATWKEEQDLINTHKVSLAAAALPPHHGRGGSCPDPFRHIILRTCRFP